MISEILLLASINTSNLNSRLQVAVCSQNWTGAIGIVDEMRTVAPQSELSLIDYRERLSALVGTEVPNQYMASCSGQVATPRQATPVRLILDSGVVLSINTEGTTQSRISSSQFVTPVTSIIDGKTTDTGQIAVDCSTGQMSIQFNSGASLESNSRNQEFSRQIASIICPK